jgi:acetylornithine deacetylase
MMTEQQKEKILKKVEENFTEETDLLTRLVRTKSIIGNEQEAQKLYAKTCSNLGLNIEMFTPEKNIIKSHPAYTPIDLDYTNRANVIAEYKGTSSGRSLILGGHIDVVSPEPIPQWTHDPWGGEVIDEKLYGRGAADMKAGLAANIYALKALVDLKLRPRGKLILESTIEEELGGSGGVLACLMHGITADGMLITEPSNEKIYVTHPGIRYFRVTVQGKTAHAALSHTGINAIAKMVPIIKALEALDIERAEKLKYPLVEKQTGRPCNLSMGKMQAGDWVSTVAGWATLECRIGFVPGETRQSVEAEIRKTIREAIKGDPWLEQNSPKLEWFGWDTDPWIEPTDSTLVKTLQETSRKIYGAQLELTGASGGLDARFGHYFSVPSVSYGPKGSNYHGVDEYVDLSSLMRVTKTLALFIADWCGVYAGA